MVANAKVKKTEENTSLSEEEIAQVKTVLADQPDGFYRSETAQLPHNILKLNGEYFVQKKDEDKSHILGKGSSGKAKLVQSLESGQWYVIKMMNARKVDLDEFEREKSNLQQAGLGYGGIVRSASERKNETRGDQYIILMQYMKGHTLDSYINKVKLQPKDWVSLFKELCHAVQQLHQHQLFHFDIKADNYIINPDTKKISPIDLGIAVTIQDNGTGQIDTDSIPPNIAPECQQPAEGEESYKDHFVLTQASEVYSIAETMNDLLGAQKTKDGVVIPGNTITDPMLRKKIEGLLTQMCSEEPKLRPTLDTITMQLAALNSPRAQFVFLNARGAKAQSTEIIKNTSTPKPSN